MLLCHILLQIVILLAHQTEANNALVILLAHQTEANNALVILLAHQTEANNALAPCIKMYVHMQIHAHTQPQTCAHKHTVTHTLSTFCYSCTWRKITREKTNGVGWGDKQKKHSWLLSSCSLSHLCAEHCNNSDAQVVSKQKHSTQAIWYKNLC